MSASRIAAIVLRSRRPDALARFYRDAFDFVIEPSTGDVPALALGNTRLRIAPAGPTTASYPLDVPGWSPLFQHCAIRVADIDAAMARLARIDGWRPISTAGAERLPANTGNVAAFKFRDPEGHPLELLASPDRRDGPLFAGIDHTAISVADVDRSVAFYAACGFVVAGRTLNVGLQQSRLDGMSDAIVDIVALRTAADVRPGVELLHYRGAFDRASVRPADEADVAATEMLFDVDFEEAQTAGPVRCDPDGHLVRSLSRHEARARSAPSTRP